MRRNLLILVLMAVALLALANLPWAQCPEDPNDLGECDTLHVVPLDNVAAGEFPRPVHVPLLVTHDSTTFYWESEGIWVQDSINGFVIPLVWNATGTCEVPPDSNTTALFGAGFGGSVFRDFGGMQNRMLDLYELGGGQEWDTRIIDIAYSHVFMCFAPSGYWEDQLWWEGQRVLLATLTFLVSDTLTICIDTTFWPPSSRLKFGRIEPATYIPRHNMPLCFGVYPPILARFSADLTQGQLPLPVQFTDQSIGEPTSWFWDFGDGDTSTQQNPLHVYVDTGYFDVTLIISTESGSDTVTKQDFIHVEENRSWVHMRGWTDIYYGETLSYNLSFQNTSLCPASPCSITLNTTSLMEYVSSDPPGILLNDSTVLWVFDDTVAPGEMRQIEVWETPAETTTWKTEPYPVAQWAVAKLKLPGTIKTIIEGMIKLLWLLPSADLTLEKVGPGSLDRLGESYDYEIPYAHIGSKLVDAWLVEISDRLRVKRGGHLYPDCEVVVTSPDPDIVELHEEAPGKWIVKWQIIPTLPRADSLNPDTWPRKNITVWVPNDMEDCSPVPETVWVENIAYIRCLETYGENPLKLLNNIYKARYPILIPRDPNEIRVHPWGFIPPGEMLLYQIFFENEGTGIADSIRIVSELDTNLVDYALFIPDTVGIYIPYTREITWDFPHINLPPDSSSHVLYWIRAADTLESGTEIKGNAVIYFENLPGVPCSTSVTVDALTPVSYVDSVVRVGFPDTFTVWWSGYDAFPGASGITMYSLYSSEDGGTDSLWFADTSWFGDDTLETSATFIGEPGHYYCFYSIAEDYVGWVEEAPGAPDACIPFLRGDTNADWIVDLTDVLFLINYLYKGGTAPNPLERGDASCDDLVELADVLFLINYLYKGGPPPQC